MCVREENRARGKEMPAVCTITVEHMLGRKSHVNSCCVRKEGRDGEDAVFSHFNEYPCNLKVSETQLGSARFPICHGRR